jgi:hypothetical protein
MLLQVLPDVKGSLAQVKSIENLLPVLGLGASVMVINGPSNGFALALSKRQCACPFLDSRSEESRLV